MDIHYPSDEEFSLSIIWLASYPKSGNTWVRAFLTAYLHSERPLDINALLGAMHGVFREEIDDLLGISSANLTAAEAQNLRPTIFRSIAATSIAPFFIKTHDIYGLTPDGMPIFPSDVSLRAIYIIRNPLDVVISLAHHQVISIDAAIAQMANESYGEPQGIHRLSAQIWQHWGSWSANVKSWHEQQNIPVEVIRYEDLLATPAQSFKHLLSAAGLEHNAYRFQHALKASDFSALKTQEQQTHFRERNPSAKSFFRAGTSGHWRKRLTSVQINKVSAQHEPIMRAHGYLP